MIEITYMRGVHRLTTLVERSNLRAWLFAHADCTVLRSVPVTAR